MSMKRQDKSDSSPDLIFFEKSIKYVLVFFRSGPSYYTQTYNLVCPLVIAAYMCMQKKKIDGPF